jgi:hypothetical protein
MGRERWQMRTFVRSSNTGVMTRLKTSIDVLRAFILSFYRTFAPCLGKLIEGLTVFELKDRNLH